MRWSVSLTAEGDRELTREEIVELADAVAPYLGVATGIGTQAYGAQLVVEAEDREEAVALARAAFAEAASAAGLPDWPIAAAETLSELEDEMDDLDIASPGAP